MDVYPEEGRLSAQTHFTFLSFNNDARICAPRLPVEPVRSTALAVEPFPEGVDASRSALYFSIISSMETLLPSVSVKASGFAAREARRDVKPPIVG
jgi:hypothetical protein